MKVNLPLLGGGWADGGGPAHPSRDGGNLLLEEDEGRLVGLPCCLDLDSGDA